MRLAYFVALSLAGCAVTPSEPAAPPQIGKADGGDRADHACNVVLRDVGFAPSTSGQYLIVDHWIVWRGHVDVSAAAIADGAQVKVLYHRRGWDWRVVDADETGTANGMTTFSFDMYDGITRGDEGGSNWSRMQIELIPFLEMPDGSRVFDHNVIADDFSNYMLFHGWDTNRRPFELTTNAGC